MYGFWFYTFDCFFLAENVEVSIKFMKKDEIVLNLSLETCRQMNLGNVWINFRARFGWIQRKIMVAVSHVFAIYSQENHQRMPFLLMARKTQIQAIPARVLARRPKKPRLALTIVK